MKTTKQEARGSTQKARCLNLPLKCLWSQIVGIDVAQALIATSHIGDNQPVLSKEEAAVWPVCRSQYMTISGYP